jgi:hypothetical protein
MNESAILESRDLREKLINRLDVLEKVKEVITLPNTDSLTMQQVAEYYEVPLKTIDAIVNRHVDELEEDGYRVISKTELVGFLNLQNEDLKTLRGKTLITINNVQIIVPSRGLRIFTRRALLRIGMLLRDSEVAKQVRTYLLDIEQAALELAPEIQQQQIEKYDKEAEIVLKIVYAKSKEEMLIALNEYHQFVEEYKQKADNLEIENKVLIDKIIGWDTRPIINKLIRRLAQQGLNHDYRLAWSKLYEELLYKYGIGVSQRLKNKSTNATIFDVLEQEELDLALKSAVALCEKNHIDISDILQLHFKE